MKRSTTNSRLALALRLGLFLALLWPVSIPGTGPSVAHAAGPWYVAPDGDDDDDCLSPATACATVNGALNKPGFVGSDTILVATGIYTGTGDQVVLLDKSATLSGGWDASFTMQSGTSTIDGEGSRRGMTVHSGVTAAVEHFVIQDGLSDWTTGDGGGIYNDGILTLSCSTVNANRVVGAFIYGGGIYNVGTLTLNNSVVSGNMGGGIYNLGGTITFNSSTVSDNGEGGIWNESDGTVTLNNSTVSSNLTGRVGGISNAGSTLILNHSTVSGNLSEGESGGGINQNGGTVFLNNCTISDNKADVAGGGIYKGDGTMTLQNTILAGNTSKFGTGPDCSGEISSSGYNLIGDTSDCGFAPGTDDLTDVGANLGRLIGMPGAPMYHPLLSGSLAIDAGNPAGCTDHLGSPLDADQRGAARVGRCDIGSYEYITPGPAAGISAVGGTPQRTAPSSTFRMSLQAAVMDSIGSPVDDATVTFSAPADGPSGTFLDAGTFTTTAVTGESGVATAAAFAANELMGSYAVTATVSGVVTPTNFLLSNFAWYVSSSGDDGNDCLTPTTPCATINGALGKIDFVAGDTIRVAVGTYTGTGEEGVRLDKDVVLSGGWQFDGTLVMQSGISIIDGEGARPGMTVDSGVTAIVERFAVQNGSAEGLGGGGIHNGGTLALNSSTVSGNSAIGHGMMGGGIYNEYGTVTLNSSTVSGNAGGGGIHNDLGIVTLDNSIVSGNTDGRGINNDGGTLVLTNSTVSGNAGGPGIYNEYGTVTLDNSAVSGNTGDGFYNWGTLTLINSAVNGNTATGINNNYGTVTLDNSTVSDNAGRGIYNYSEGSTVTLSSSTVNGNMTTDWSGGGGIYNGGTATLQNTIVAGNTASETGPDCSGTIASAGYNIIGDTSGCTFTPGLGDLTNVDPKLGPLKGSPGYHPVFLSSPAINAGNPDGCIGSTGPLVTDQRGFPRFGRCDIGAYEMQPIGFSTKAAGRLVALPGDPLTYTITLTNGGAVDIADVRVTDTLPISITYIHDSLIATSGSYSCANGAITWTGSVSAGEAVIIAFGATVSQTVSLGTFITNSAVISGDREVFIRTAIVDIVAQVYLPIVIRND